MLVSEIKAPMHIILQYKMAASLAPKTLPSRERNLMTLPIGGEGGDDDDKERGEEAEVFMGETKRNACGSF